MIDKKILDALRGREVVLFVADKGSFKDWRTILSQIRVQFAELLNNL